MSSLSDQRLQKDDIIRIRRLISGQVHRTPVLTSSLVNDLFDKQLFFKCENFQKTGSFKFRGACHAVMQVKGAVACQGVSTHSSGNHAQALALAGRQNGIPVRVVMPDNASRIKVEAVKQYGASITFCAPTLEARESCLKELIEQYGTIEVHPYNDYRIIGGQSTVAAELFEEVPDLDALIVPVGGGGLLSGSILSTQFFSPLTKVFGAEPLQADDAARSFRSKSWFPSIRPDTIADGLKTSLGSLTYPIIMEGVHDILTVTEKGIVDAMRLLWERMKIVVEPSAAVTLGVLMEHKDIFTAKKIGLIVSGGNVDLDHLPWQKNNRQ